MIWSVVRMGGCWLHGLSLYGKGEEEERGEREGERRMGGGGGGRRRKEGRVNPQSDRHLFSISCTLLSSSALSSLFVNISLLWGCCTHLVLPSKSFSCALPAPTASHACCFLRPREVLDVLIILHYCTHLLPPPQPCAIDEPWQPCPCGHLYPCFGCLGMPTALHTGTAVLARARACLLWLVASSPHSSSALSLSLSRLQDFGDMEPFFFFFGALPSFLLP